MIQKRGICRLLFKQKPRCSSGHFMFRSRQITVKSRASGSRTLSLPVRTLADASDCSSVLDFPPETDVPSFRLLSCEQILARTASSGCRTEDTGNMFPVMDWPHANDTELVEGSKCSVRIQVLSSRCGGMNRDKQNDLMMIL